MDKEKTKAQEEARKKLTAFVIDQMKKGASKEAIVAKITEAGIESSQAAALVNAIEIQAQAASEEEELSAGSIVGALAGGLVAAVGGGIAWGLIVKATGYEIGYMATGIGLLTGFAVVFFSGKKGQVLQLIAVLSALIGIGMGKYTAFYYVLNEFVTIEYGEAAAGLVNIFSSEVFTLFFQSLTEMASFYDVLWILLAIVAAWRIPRGLGIRQANKS